MDSKSCVVCGAKDYRKKFKRLDADFVECPNCGLIRMKHIPSYKQISDHYARKFQCGNYDLIQKYDAAYRNIYKKLLSFTIVYAGDPQGLRLLDIGCFTGRFLDLAQQAGFLTYGVEYQPEAARIANKKHCGRVYCGPIESYSGKSSDPFDVVTLSGVIEHVRAPDATLKLTAGLLKQGGIFIIQTPNTASGPARLLGKWWPAYAPVEHIYYFSSRNIKILLERYGFRVIKLIDHWKKLPVLYVYSQFQNFGPEYYKLISKVIPLIPKTVLNWRLPFYGGEMLLVAERI